MDREGPLIRRASIGLGSRGSEAIVLDSWAVGSETMAVATHLGPLGRDGPTYTDGSGRVMALWRRPFKPSASDPVTANSICWRLSACR